MREAPELLSAELKVGEALEQVRSSEAGTWLVANGRGLVGVLNRSTLENGLRGQSLADLTGISDFPHVHSDRMGANQLSILPVVSRADIHQLEGIVTLRDVLQSFGIAPDDA